MLKTKFLPTIVITLFILSIPFIGMRVSNEIVWSMSEFIVVGLILMVAGFVFETVARRGGSLAYKFAVSSAIGIPLLLVWANLAVGLIGNEDNPANLLYIGVALLAIGGSVISRFKAGGMYRTMIVSATAQLLVPVFAYFIYKPDSPTHDFGMIGVFLASAVFAVMFLASAFLFRASQKNSEA